MGPACNSKGLVTTGWPWETFEISRHNSTPAKLHCLDAQAKQVGGATGANDPLWRLDGGSYRRKPSVLSWWLSGGGMGGMDIGTSDPGIPRDLQTAKPKSHEEFHESCWKGFTFVLAEDVWCSVLYGHEVRTYSVSWLKAPDIQPEFQKGWDIIYSWNED